MKKIVVVKYYDENNQEWISDSDMIQDIFDSEDYSDELIVECCKDYLKGYVIDNSSNNDERDKKLDEIEKYEFVVKNYKEC